jgi:hypothetical protein
MKRLILFAALLATFLIPAPSAGAFSDWIGTYAIIDKVILEPNATSPERIQIWGDFAMAKANDRNYYDAPQRGYLYFKLMPGKEDGSRKEWADLKAVAGTGEIIGFGARNIPPAKVRDASVKAADPETYPFAHGLVRMSARSSNYEPFRALRALERPKAPKGQ